MFHGSRTLYALEQGRAAVLVNVIGWGTVIVAVGVGFAVVGRDGPILAVLSGATAVGMTVGGLAALLAVARRAGRASLAGLGRTLPVLLVGAALAAWAGRWVVGSVLMLVGGGVWSALVAALGGAFLAVVVVAGVFALFDRGTFQAFWRAERSRFGRPGPPPDRNGFGA
jgi:putative peptidoglycan lipid II flippase